MSTLIHLVGWTLVHFIWQGALVALAADGALRLYHNRSANARYVIACLALAAMLASPLITARVLMASHSTAAATVRAGQNLAAPGLVSTALHGWANDHVLSTPAVSTSL